MKRLIFSFMICFTITFGINKNTYNYAEENKDKYIIKGKWSSNSYDTEIMNINTNVSVYTDNWFKYYNSSENVEKHMKLIVERGNNENNEHVNNEFIHSNKSSLLALRTVGDRRYLVLFNYDFNSYSLRRFIISLNSQDEYEQDIDLIANELVAKERKIIMEFMLEGKKKIVEKEKEVIEVATEDSYSQLQTILRSKKY